MESLEPFFGFFLPHYTLRLKPPHQLFCRHSSTDCFPEQLLPLGSSMFFGGGTRNPPPVPQRPLHFSSGNALWTGEHDQSCSRKACTPAVPIPEKSQCICQPLPTEGFFLHPLRDALVVPNPEGWGRHWGTYPRSPLSTTGQRGPLLSLRLNHPSLSNLAVPARKLKAGKEKKKIQSGPS